MVMVKKALKYHSSEVHCVQKWLGRFCEGLTFDENYIGVYDRVFVAYSLVIAILWFCFALAIVGVDFTFQSGHVVFNIATY